MSHDDYDATADVFSMGIVLTEVVAAQEAEEIIDQTRTAHFTVDEARTMAKYCTEELYPNEAVRQIVADLIKLAGWCCHLKPAERPTAEQIAGRLQRIQLAYQAKRLRAVSRVSSHPSMASRESSMGGDSSEPEVRSQTSEVFNTQNITLPATPMADPQQERAASQVFEFFDQDDDGYLDYDETRLLAQLSDGYDLTTDEYRDLCRTMGASSSKGLSQDDVVHMYAHLGMGDAKEDLLKVSTHTNEFLSDDE